MSEQWAVRQRQTNKLVRAAAAYVLGTRAPSPDALYGLCKLTWITNSYMEEDAGYITSTKIPALEDVFGQRYEGMQLSDIAKKIASLTRSKKLTSLVTCHTGFTNFYRPYRNTAREWISEHHARLLPMFRAAYELSTDAQGLELTRKIATLPKIPKANHPESPMRPEYLLTPVFFALDRRLRYPLINGNQGVRKLLAKLKATNASLDEQYSRMISLYGSSGIADAADLDQVGGDLPDLTPLSGQRPTKKLLKKKPITGKNLPLKDEDDIRTLQNACVVVSRRRHNMMTNMLKEALSRFTLLEGSDKNALFDVLVKEYEEGHDLLVEVKSSNELADIRMAIGQLYSYWHRVKGQSEPHLAILLPEVPSSEAALLLEWLGIGCLWFDDDGLQTSTEWLGALIGG